MKYGVIDLGSNTIRLIIYKVNKSGIQRAINIKLMNKSITHIDGDRMTIDGIKSIANDLSELSAIAKAYNLDKLCCFATASLRNISNTDEALSVIYEMSHILPELLSGEEEAYFDFVGAKHDLRLVQENVIVDVGGGSTEIIHVRDENCINSISLPFGSLNMYVRFVKHVFPSLKEQAKLRSYVREQVNKVSWLKELQADKMIGIGGSARALIKLHIANNSFGGELHGYTIKTKDVNKLSNLTSANKSSGIRLLSKVLPERYTTALPGICIFSELSKIFNSNAFTLCRYGVREGYLLERMIQNEAIPQKIEKAGAK